MDLEADFPCVGFPENSAGYETPTSWNSCVVNRLVQCICCDLEAYFGVDDPLDESTHASTYSTPRSTESALSHYRLEPKNLSLGAKPWVTTSFQWQDDVNRFAFELVQQSYEGRSKCDALGDGLCRKSNFAVSSLESSCSTRKYPVTQQLSHLGQALLDRFQGASSKKSLSSNPLDDMRYRPILTARYSDATHTNNTAWYVRLATFALRNLKGPNLLVPNVMDYNSRVENLIRDPMYVSLLAYYVLGCVGLSLRVRSNKHSNNVFTWVPQLLLKLNDEGLRDTLHTLPPPSAVWQQRSRHSSGSIQHPVLVEVSGSLYDGRQPLQPTLPLSLYASRGRSMTPVLRPPLYKVRVPATPPWRLAPWKSRFMRPPVGPACPNGAYIRSPSPIRARPVRFPMQHPLRPFRPSDDRYTRLNSLSPRFPHPRPSPQRRECLSKTPHQLRPRLPSRCPSRIPAARPLNRLPLRGPKQYSLSVAPRAGMSRTAPLPRRQRPYSSGFVPFR